MFLSTKICVVAFATTISLAEGAIRSLVQQRAAGECATDDQATEDIYAIDFLTSFRIMGGSTLAEIDTPISSADLIQLDYGANFKVLKESYAQEQYVLTQCGTGQPSDEEVDSVQALPTGYTRKFFTIPLQQARAESTVQLGFLHALGLHDRVTQVSQYAVGSCWQKSISCGGLAVDSYTNATLQTAQRGAVDAFFADCPWDWNTNAPNCAALHAMPTAVHFSASQDPAPLQSAEHVKFMAAFFNKEADAQAFFDTKVSAMQTIKEQSAAIADADRPVVAWIEKTWDGKVKLNTPAYQKLLVEYAGGQIVDAAAIKAALGNQMDDSNQTTNLSAFFDALMNVDAVVDLTYSSNVTAYDFNAFLTTFDLDASSNLPFIQNNLVFRVDAQISGTSNLDWFESRIAHPDLAVEGLKRVLQSDSASPKKYFRNIATGEVAEVLIKEDCSTTLMTCDSSEYPSELPMITPAPTPAPTDATASASSAIGKLTLPFAYIVCLCLAMLA